MKPLIISFSQSNYITEPHGVEKYIKELSKEYLDNELNLLHFFSFSDIKVKNCVGVIYNNNFIGLFHYKDLISITYNIQKKYDTRICCIQLQHLLNQNLQVLINYIEEFRVPVYLFVHDYYLLCNRYNLINSDGMFCGVEKPCFDKCKGCRNWTKESKHIKEVEKFIDGCIPYLKYIIVPSKYVYDVFAKCWDKYREYLRIREHMKCEGNIQYGKVKDTLKIAFAGEQTDKKGFNYYEKLAEDLSGNSYYKMLYFGAGSQKVQNVENVYVSIAEQGTDAMKNAIKSSDICLAYVWSVWPETYSYVYYELLSNGVFIITNKNSGNIATMVKEYKNGRVFDNYEEAIEWLANTDNVIKEVNEYRTGIGYKPACIYTNSSLQDIIPEANDLKKLMAKEFTADVRNVNRCKLLSYMYRRMKYD